MSTLHTLDETLKRGLSRFGHLMLCYFEIHTPTAISEDGPMQISVCQHCDEPIERDSHWLASNDWRRVDRY